MEASRHPISTWRSLLIRFVALGAFASGVELTHGQAGEVTGQPDSDYPGFGECVAVEFSGDELSTICICLLDNLSRAKP